MLEKLRRLRTDHLLIQSNLEFYEYQEEISDGIIQALLENLRITANVKPEEVEKLKQYEHGWEISRQAGKTTGVGETVSFVETFFPQIFKRPIRVGIFAKQLDQAKLSYKIVRRGLRKAKSLMMITPDQEKFIAEEENARQIVLPDGSFVVVAPISAISQIEGLALDLIIIDEGQIADDEIVDHSIRPMGKTTNAPIIWIGKAGTQICHFYRMGQRGKVKKIYFPEVSAQRKELYERSKDARHLIYEQSVKSDIIEYGEDSDYIQREYFGAWQIGTGQFTTAEELDGLYDNNRGIAYNYSNTSDKRTAIGEVFAGVDTAKHPDSTVVTFIRENKQRRIKELIAWLELRGENYQDQFDIIMDSFSRYKPVALAIDSTGQGDFMPDLFEKNSQWQDEHSGLYRVKFSAVSKDALYKNLLNTIKESLTRLPKIDKRYGERFRMQMLDLQKEYKGQLLSVKHPDSPNAHDDYPDSWALAEWAYAKWNENKLEISSVEVISDAERSVRRDEKGKVVDYWPGLE